MKDSEPIVPGIGFITLSLSLIALLLFTTLSAIQFVFRPRYFFLDMSELIGVPLLLVTSSLFVGYFGWLSFSPGSLKGRIPELALAGMVFVAAIVFCIEFHWSFLSKQSGLSAGEQNSSGNRSVVRTYAKNGNEDYWSADAKLREKFEYFMSASPFSKVQFVDSAVDRFATCWTSDEIHDPGNSVFEFVQSYYIGLRTMANTSIRVTKTDSFEVDNQTVYQTQFFYAGDSRKVLLYVIPQSRGRSMRALSITGPTNMKPFVSIDSMDDKNYLEIVKFVNWPSSRR